MVPYLRKHRTDHLEERMAAGSVWEDTGLVFTTAVGSPVDPRNAKRVYYRGYKITIYLDSGSHPVV